MTNLPLIAYTMGDAAGVGPRQQCPDQAAALADHRPVAGPQAVDREGGVGGPANFVLHSHLQGRPAVRFSQWTGLASSPGNPVDIRGDAALTMTLVMNLTPFDGQHSHTTVFGIGNPAHSGDPGRPLAALLEIDQTQQSSLDFAGGWGHDAVLAPGSYQTHFGKPVIVTIIKTPGPIKDTTHFYINGQLAAPLDGHPVTGRDTVPDFQHRTDIGVFLGKALSWCGAFQGDVGEVLLYNKALGDADRLGVEAYLGEKFGLWIDEQRSVARKPVFTEQEKSHWAYQPVRKTDPPGVRNAAWLRTPIDRFALAAFEAHGITPPPETDKRTFLRRVTFDLTGLPPTPEEIDDFLADTSPEAYETVVDRLLRSPHYGERWGRHWLDVARAEHVGRAETHGEQRIFRASLHAGPHRTAAFGAVGPRARDVAEHHRRVCGHERAGRGNRHVVRDGRIRRFPHAGGGDAEAEEAGVDRAEPFREGREVREATVQHLSDLGVLHAARCSAHDEDRRDARIVEAFEQRPRTDHTARAKQAHVHRTSTGSASSWCDAAWRTTISW